MMVSPSAKPLAGDRTTAPRDGFARALTRPTRRLQLLRCGLVASCSVVLAACNSDAGARPAIVARYVTVGDSGRWSASDQRVLVRELAFAPAEAPRWQPGSHIEAVLADGAGQLFVLDRGGRQVLQFGANGHYVSAYGELPGGLSLLADPVGMTCQPSGALWIVDPQQNRYLVFAGDTTPMLVQRPVGGYVAPWQGGFEGDTMLRDVVLQPDTSGRPLGWAARFELASGRMHPSAPLPPPVTGSLHHVTTSGSTIVAAVPLAPRAMWVMAPGILYVARSDRYHVARVDTKGDTTLVLQREVLPRALLDAERDSVRRALQWYAAQGGRIDESALPQQRPIIEGLIASDEGELWVRHYLAPTDTAVRFDVFAPDGAFEGVVYAERGLQAHPAPMIARGVLAGVLRASDGTEYVVRYRIVTAREQEMAPPQQSTRAALIRTGGPCAPATIHAVGQKRLDPRHG